MVLDTERLKHDKNLPSQDAFETALTECALRLWLVEDNAADVRLTRHALDATCVPYTLHVAEKGDEALEQLFASDKDTLPDALLLDLGLPCMNGFEIVEALSHAPAAVRALPIIILTGFPHFDFMRKSAELWIPAYIAKPCNPAALREALTRIRAVH